MRRIQRAMLPVVAATALSILVIPVGSAFAGSGTANYNGCVTNWSNSASGSSLAASTVESSGCSRVRARIYYRNSGGSYVLTTNGWVTGSSASASAIGEGVYSKHNADTDLSGSFGDLQKSF